MTQDGDHLVKVYMHFLQWITYNFSHHGREAQRKDDIHVAICYLHCMHANVPFLKVLTGYTHPRYLNR